MKFDFCIGNPPYQDVTESESTRMPPVYNLFMDEAYKVAEKVELITPARFLFDAGYTPKEWNQKMLNDEHFKVMTYEPQSNVVFSNTDIKGGVIVSYRDEKKNFGAIGVFTKFPELNSIIQKVVGHSSEMLDSIISSPLSYQVTELFKQENPELVDRLRSSAFTNLAKVFFESRPQDNHEYIEMIGILDNKRVKRFIRSDYVRDISGTLEKYTVLLPKASGSGVFGEAMAPSLIAPPKTGYTQTFIGIGQYDTIYEAQNTDKYIKTKFARAMLGVLKITQDCPGPKWRYVPLQDFTSASDICWSKSLNDIDHQLYKKYDLSDEEITFIESHVKEMK